MKVSLISTKELNDSDFKISSLQESVLEDLEMNPILKAMSGDDKYLQNVVLNVWFHPLMTEKEINFRQAAVKDGLEHVSEIENFFKIINDGIYEARNEYWSLDSGSASYKLHSFARQIDIYLKYAEKIKSLSEVSWQSKNFLELFQRFDAVFSHQAIDQMHGLIDLIVSSGSHSYPVKLNKDFGSEVADLDYSKKSTRFDNIIGSVKSRFEKNESKFVIPDRDDNSSNALGHYDNVADYNLAVKVVNTEKELENLFDELKFQIGFIYSVNRLTKSLPTNIEISYPKVSTRVSILNLKNTVLLLHDHDVTEVVGNDIETDNLKLVIISGVNQGGKTTTLRSLGQAQMMMQSGMYVFADHYESPTYQKIYTHFKREEDSKLNSGKLDFELDRMSKIVDDIDGVSLILMNESFSSTNEHEGSRLNAEVVSGLVNSGMSVISVTHQFEFAHLLTIKENIDIMYLRPERKADGVRSFKLKTGKPLKTSFGIDIYDRIFQNNLTENV